eukprot:scaffold125113_cov27-Phaeocystis_antarctica.AAC.1
MQSRCSISSTLASRPLPSLDPPRHTCRWTLPSGTSARFNFARRPPAVGQSYAASTSCIRLSNSARMTCQSGACRCTRWAPYRDKNPAKKNT